MPSSVGDVVIGGISKPMLHLALAYAAKRDDLKLFNKIWNSAKDRGHLNYGYVNQIFWSACKGNDLTLTSLLAPHVDPYIRLSYPHKLRFDGTVSPKDRLEMCRLVVQLRTEQDLANALKKAVHEDDIGLFDFTLETIKDKKDVIQKVLAEVSKGAKSGEYVEYVKKLKISL